MVALVLAARGQWRVKLTELEAYIQRAYQAAAESLSPTPIPPNRAPCPLPVSLPFVSLRSRLSTPTKMGRRVNSRAVRLRSAPVDELPVAPNAGQIGR